MLSRLVPVATPRSDKPWRFIAYGTAFGLRGNHQFALEQAAVRLRWLGWTVAAGGEIDVEYDLRVSPPDAAATAPEFYELYCDGSFVRSSMDLVQLLDAFEDHAKLLTAYRAEGRLFVHAGAVSWRGCGIVIPGRSRAGKTTLVRALVDAGALYYSDEFAVLDREGLMHPYALPLSMRASQKRPALRTSIDAIGGCAGTVPVGVRLIVVTQYRRYARWHPRRLSPGLAFLALMDNTVAARRAPETTMPVLRRSVLEATAVQSLRGNAQSMAAAVLAEVDDLL